MNGWASGSGLKLPDIPRIYTALAEWLACILCILELKRRFHGLKLVGISIAALAVQSAYLVLTKGKDGILWFLIMMAAMVFMDLFIYSCCDLNILDAVYTGIRAFVIAEFAASLEWELYCYVYYECGFSYVWVAPLILVGTYGTVYLITWCLSREVAGKEECINITVREIVFAAVIGLAVFLISNIGFAYTNTPFGGRYSAEIFNVRTLVDLGGLAIFYAYHIQRMHLRSQLELESMEMILHNHYVQYQQSQETLELINYKYHDLKHHIIALRAEESAQKRGEYLDRMEEEIKSYGAQQHTGNSVLDTLLTSKSLYCLRHDISLTIVADGALLDFIDIMDICSIFGNALDNAIECEKKIADIQKRMIHLSVFSQKSFLIIRLENYCEDQLQFDRQLPVTTKKNAEFHGFGLKSLRRTVHKYGGEVDISLQDGWFSLKILIPCPADPGRKPAYHADADHQDEAAGHYLRNNPGEAAGHYKEV